MDILWHDLLLGILAFFSEILGTVSGFGSSTFFVPVALRFETFHLVLALTSLLHCMSNLVKIFLFKTGPVDKRFWIAAAVAVPLTALGAYLSRLIDSRTASLLLGVFLVLFGFLRFFHIDQLKLKNVSVSFLFLALSGFLTGLIGTGGSLRGLALSTLQLSSFQFVFYSSLIDLGGDILRAGIYIEMGYMDWSQAFYLPILFAASWVGAHTGKKILNKIPLPTFEKILSVSFVLSGLILVVEGFR
jgi:uncharacterized membrane protein YfcA